MFPPNTSTDFVLLNQIKLNLVSSVELEALNNKIVAMIFLSLSHIVRLSTCRVSTEKFYVSGNKSVKHLILCFVQVNG